MSKYSSIGSYKTKTFTESQIANIHHDLQTNTRFKLKKGRDLQNMHCRSKDIAVSFNFYYFEDSTFRHFLLTNDERRNVLRQIKRYYDELKISVPASYDHKQYFVNTEDTYLHLDDRVFKVHATCATSDTSSITKRKYFLVSTISRIAAKNIRCLTDSIKDTNGNELCNRIDDVTRYFSIEGSNIYRILLNCVPNCEHIFNHDNLISTDRIDNLELNLGVDPNDILVVTQYNIYYVNTIDTYDKGFIFLLS
jgi:hypothetical protein